MKSEHFIIWKIKCFMKQKHFLNCFSILFFLKVLFYYKSEICLIISMSVIFSKKRLPVVSAILFWLFFFKIKVKAHFCHIAQAQVGKMDYDFKIDTVVLNWESTKPRLCSKFPLFKASWWMLKVLPQLFPLESSLPYLRAFQRGTVWPCT